ncbi:hypothetical protein V493_07824, partial [Pseudogymnoascus sp. VKM F-4281 (FW-2241)]
MHRLRCNGHIINLAVQAFLFATDDEDLAVLNNAEILSTPSQEEMERWRKKGPLSKLHNIVVHIQQSTQRRVKFKQLSSGLSLVRDNATRWNSCTDSFLGPCCNAGWKKLDKYYSMTERTATYFDGEWLEDWVKDTRLQVENLWLQQYKTTAVSDAVLELEVEQDNLLHNEFLQWRMQKEGSVNIIQDEYQQYCSAPIVRTSNARAWWLEPTQRKTYPNLSIMALDLLAIPSMAAALERLFSKAKITITERRNSMQIESINATECCKSWFKSKYMPPFIDDELTIVTDSLLEDKVILPYTDPYT